jgi:hypothetical protein
MTPNLASYDRVQFNRLPSIETADETLRRENKLQIAFSSLESIFAKYDLCDTWGIGLLHNHWLLEDNEIPVQHISLRNGVKEYVTAPRANLQDGMYWPSLISVIGGREITFRPLEFSTDRLVALANQRLAERPEFLKEFGRRMIESELESTFGLVVFKETTEPDLELLEFNFVERISIVREVNAGDHSKEKLIQTAWRFSPNESTMDCTKSCFQRCSDPGNGTHRNDGHAPVHAPS